MQISPGLCQIEQLPQYLYTGKPTTPHVDLLKATETKSYIPIPGSVLTYILSNSELSHLEKLYYISADSLNLINANTGKQRSVALSSHKWAIQLGCSRAQVFKLQQSLSDKGYFTIIKDKNKSGQNKRNLIITTLPSKVFDLLVKEPNRAGDHLPYNPVLEHSRAYLDRTKLFIRLNYHLLKTITANEQLTAFHKILWLDLFVKCYKSNSIKNKNTNIESEFSLKVSYSELVDRYSCDKRYLSKAMRALEATGFIFREHFYIKGEKLTQDRRDKSLWQITLSIPNEHRDILSKLNDRSNLKLSAGAVESIIATRKLPVLKVNEQNEQQEYQEDLSYSQYRLANSAVASLEATLDITNIKRNKIVESKTLAASYDPDVAEFRPLLNKDFITNKKNIKNIDSLDRESAFFKKSVSSKNYFKESEKTESANKEKINPNTTPNISSASVFASKRLKDLYPLDKTLVYELNHKSGREFSTNFVNELLLKLDSKYPLKTFNNKKQIMNYLAKALRYEKHQEPVVNHESFKFASYDPEEQKKDKIDKYLAAIESNLNTNAASQLRRKIAALFNPETAYRLLTESKYIRPQPEIFFVELAHNLNLTEIQQDRLTNEIQLIYGKDIEVMYGEMAASTFDNKATKIVRQEGEIYLEELDQDTAWYRVRVALRSQFGEALDKAWFSKLTAEEDTAQRKITLKAPTKFFRDWITQKYGAAIENSCKIIHYQFDALVT